MLKENQDNDIECLVNFMGKPCYKVGREKAILGPFMEWEG